MTFFKNFQKIHIFLFVLLLLSMNAMNAIAEGSDASESGMPAKIDSDVADVVNKVEGSDAIAEAPDAIKGSVAIIEGSAAIEGSDTIYSDIVDKVERLNGKIDLLNGKVDQLISRDYVKKNDLTLAFIALALLILLSGVLNIGLLMEIKKTKATKKQDVWWKEIPNEDIRAALREKPSFGSSGEKNSATASASRLSSASKPPAQPKEPPRPEPPQAEESRAAPREKPSYGSSGEKNGVSAPAPRLPGYSQLPAQPKEPPRPVDETPQLYHSKEKREERRVGAGDAYLDVNAAVYERFSQGERVRLSFEKSSNYLASPLALVDDSLLYVNFHRFNESLEIPNDMRPMMAQIYDISGALPGFVKSCAPAKVVSKDGKYEVAARGALYMKS